MRRTLFFLALLVAGIGSILIGLAARVGAHAAAPPAVTCEVAPIDLAIQTVAGPPAGRAVPNVAGDSYVQFLLPPLTTTASSGITLTVNGSFAGTVSGSLNGSVTADTENGILVTSPGGLSPYPRGFTVSRLFLSTDQGAITATLALNFAAVGAAPYPRAVAGYLASDDMSGALAGKLLVVPVAGYETLAGGEAIFAGAGLGRLFSGAAPLTAGVAGLRAAPDDRVVDLLAGDAISQFLHPLLITGAAAAGHVEAGTTLAGTLGGGGLSGGILVPLNSLLLDSGPNSGQGWQVGNLTFTDGTDALTGAWLGDLSNSSNLSSLVYEVGGTGVYSDSMLFGHLSGSYFAGGTAFAGTMTGSYCAGSALPTGTPAPSVTPAPTDTATVPPPSDTATAPPASGTPAPPSATVTALPPSATASPAPPCVVTFSDVFPGDYYYPAVQYLACQGVVSGYACGSPNEPCDPANDPYLRPGATTTRGQIAKMVAIGSGWAIQTPVTATFADVPAGQPFYPFIETAAAHGIISGYACGGPGEGCDGQNRPYFRPYNDVTRGQLSKIIGGARGWPPGMPPTPTFADVPPDNAFYGLIEAAAARGIISGYACGSPTEPCDQQDRPYFRPYTDATRGQLSKILYNALLQP